MNRSHETIPPPYTGTGAVPNISSSFKSPYFSPHSSASTPTMPPYEDLSPKFPPPPPNPYHAQPSILRRSIPLWRALPCALGALFWSAQMIYFFFYFTSRPALADGSWPRIGPSYAGFPFISCVGAVRELSFKVVSILVAVLLWVGFGIDYAIGSRSPVGIWWRRGKLFMASTSNCFLIALSFASVDEHHRLHLIFTSFQIFGMGLCKACDWNLARAMRLRTPGNRFLKKSRVWKRIAAVIAMPCSILAIVGIYGCSAKFEGGKVVFTPVCWSLVSFAAPAEWVLSWCWVIFLGTVAYDNYHLDYTVRLLLSTPPVPKPKSHGLAFWRKWTQRESKIRDNTQGWEKERQYLKDEAAPMAESSNFRVFDARRESQEYSQHQQGQQQQSRQPWAGKSYAAGGNFHEELDERDISGSGLYEPDLAAEAEMDWQDQPPMRPRSMIGTGEYHHVGGSPRVGARIGDV